MRKCACAREERRNESMEKIVRITIITASLTFIAGKEMDFNVTVSSVGEIEPAIR